MVRRAEGGDKYLVGGRKGCIGRHTRSSLGASPGPREAPRGIVRASAGLPQCLPRAGPGHYRGYPGAAPGGPGLGISYFLTIS